MKTPFSLGAEASVVVVVLEVSCPVASTFWPIPDSSLVCVWLAWPSAFWTSLSLGVPSSAFDAASAESSGFRV